MKKYNACKTFFMHICNKTNRQKIFVKYLLLMLQFFESTRKHLMTNNKAIYISGRVNVYFIWNK